MNLYKANQSCNRSKRIIARYPTTPLLFLAILLVFAVGAGTTKAAIQLDEWRWSDVSRLVVLPDIHGAYEELIELLKATGVVDTTLSWTGGETHLVSLGDLLDRGTDSRKVMDLLMRLQKQAPGKGGRVHVVNGNHELMNLTADLRYVSKGEYAAFSEEELVDVRKKAFATFLAEQTAVSENSGEPVDEGSIRSDFEARFPPGYFGHRAAFSPNGRYGAWLLSLPVLIVINDIAFVHGGLPETISSMDLQQLNRRFSSDLNRYLQVWRKLIDSKILPLHEVDDFGDVANALALRTDPSKCAEMRQAKCAQIQKSATEDLQNIDAQTMALIKEFIDLSEAPLLGVDGPTWYRGSVLCSTILEDATLEAALKKIQAKRVVVGHTVTRDFRVHEIHQNRLVMLDTGMLRKHYKGRPAALVVENDRFTVQYLYPHEQTTPIIENRFESYGKTRPQLLEAITSGVILETREGGPTGSKHVKLDHKGKEVNALFYTADRNKSGHMELAAYHLDQLLGVNLVPPTVQREVEGVKGALQLWYPGTLSQAQRIEKGLSTGGWCPMTPQYGLMNVWDLLILNRGRTAENILYRQPSWQLQLTGHSSAFSTQSKLPKKITADDLALVPGVVAALKTLNKTRLHEALGRWLNRKQIRSLLSRRDQIIERFAGQ